MKFAELLVELGVLRRQRSSLILPPLRLPFMDIHFVSTLTPEDEDQYAQAVLNAIRALLDLTPIAYTLRIETANSRVFQIAKSEPRAEGASEDMEGDTTFVPGRVTFS
jgi:hypothetical protein